MIDEEEEEEEEEEELQDSDDLFGSSDGSENSDEVSLCDDTMFKSVSIKQEAALGTQFIDKTETGVEPDRVAKEVSGSDYYLKVTQRGRDLTALTNCMRDSETALTQLQKPERENPTNREVINELNSSSRSALRPKKTKRSGASILSELQEADTSAPPQLQLRSAPNKPFVKKTSRFIKKERHVLKMAPLVAVGSFDFLPPPCESAKDDKQLLSVPTTVSDTLLDSLCSDGLPADSEVTVKDTSDSLETIYAASQSGYSQMQLESNEIQSTKTTREYRNQVTDYDLPGEVCEVYHTNGINELFPWQVACLNETKVLDGEDLIFCAPTSGGKTLISEMAIVKQLQRHVKRKVIFVVPYVSMVMERVESLTKLLDPLKVVVGTQAAGKGNRLLLDDVAVCTIERGNSIMNTIIDMGRVSEVSTIVVDELHMISDPDRGYLLELFLAKLLYAHHSDVQIIGMSATLPNATLLATWLRDAWFFSTNYRPVPLTEWYATSNTLMSVNDTSRELQKFEQCAPDDRVANLVLETISEGNSVLVFCSSKRLVESTASRLAQVVQKFTLPVSDEHQKQRREAIDQLSAIPSGVDPTLAESIPHGVGYHHAGLCIEERDVVEECFRNGSIHTLTCTTTLAAGVNLPARRVIFVNTRIGLSRIDTTRYKQAAGRAGRAGLDTVGESIILGKQGEEAFLRSLIEGPLKASASSLTHTNRGMIRAIGEVIASGAVSSVCDIQRYVSCTFACTELGEEAVVQSTQSALKFLEQNDFITWNLSNASFTPTRLAIATFRSGLSPEEARVVYENLQIARQHFIMSHDLHLVYHCTPCVTGITPCWRDYFQLFIQLSAEGQKIGRLVGVDEGTLAMAAHQPPNESDPRCGTLNRFFAAMILYELAHEVSIATVSVKYSVQRGDLQRLMSAAASFSGMVAAFSEQLNWWGFAPLIQQLQERIRDGVTSDLVPLMQIPKMKSYRARALYQAGYRTVDSIASAPASALEAALARVEPFLKKNSSTGGHRIGKLLCNSAKKLLLQTASELKVEYDDVIEKAKTLPTSDITEQTEQTEAEAMGGIKRPKTDPRITVGAGYGKAVLQAKTNSHSAVEYKAQIPTCNSSSYSIKELLLKDLNEASVFQAEVRFISQLRSAQCCGICFDSQGVAICMDASTVYYYELNAARFNTVLERLLNENITKVAYGMKDQLKMMMKRIDNKNKPLIIPNIVDPRIACWMIQPDDKFEGELTATLELLFKQQLRTSSSLRTEVSSTYSATISQSCKSAIQSMVLMRHVLGNLQFNDLLIPFRELEMPFVNVIAFMEYVGISFNNSVFSEYASEMTSKARYLENLALKVTGYKWSLASPADCARALFDNQKLPLVTVRKIHQEDYKQRKKRIESRSTSAAVLTKLIQLVPENPLPNAIREHRTHVGWLTKYVYAIPKFVSKSTGRVHSEILQTATNTGRLAVLDPSLQTIPHPIQFETVTSINNNKKELMVIELRKAFIPSNGMVLVSADYSQIEVRLMAHFSEDSEMISFLRKGGDVFRQIASGVCKKSPSEVSHEERKIAKAICYGMLYGKGVKSLSEDLDCSPEEASSFLHSFRNSFAGVTKYIKSVVVDCRTNGFVTTLFNRKRYLPTIYSVKDKERASAERQAINTVCQGSAADIVKKAMIELHDVLPPRGRILVQIHDELLFEVEESYLRPSLELIKKTMENVCTLKVPLPVNLKVGPSWGELDDCSYMVGS
eukprot:TRINITY_DN1512_c1_g1_i1.p1 TRINITY_DN1512_c1_g1~~TRINITY_DN1512_c1_g1_i1.p1  ORF type:complete len:1742 (+),score=318.74 TRINITY_DN1512_c1_g1_i1:57-5228(+)